jgi:hypothetical protein
MTDEPLSGEVIPPRRSDHLPAASGSSIALPQLSTGLLWAVKYWGVARAMDRFRRAIEAEELATRAVTARNLARVDLGRSLEQMANIDAIRQIERERIEAEALRSAAQLRQIKHETERDAARTELEALQAQDALARYKRKRDISTSIKEIAKRAEWHATAEQAKAEFVKRYGDPPPPFIQKWIEEIDALVANGLLPDMPTAGPGTPEAAVAAAIERMLDENPG